MVTLPLVAVLLVPAMLAATPFTVRAPPLGADVSEVNVRTVLALALPRTSALVNVLPAAAGALGLAVHE